MSGIDKERIRLLLNQKKYDVVLNSLQYHQHPIYLDLVQYSKEQVISYPVALSVNDIELSDEDVIGLINQLKSTRLQDRIVSSGGILISVIAIAIGLYGVVLLISFRGLFGMPYIFALPTGIFMFRMFYVGMRDS